MTESLPSSEESKEGLGEPLGVDPAVPIMVVMVALLVWASAGAVSETSDSGFAWALFGGCAALTSVVTLLVWRRVRGTERAQAPQRKTQIIIGVFTYVIYTTVLRSHPIPKVVFIGLLSGMLLASLGIVLIASSAPAATRSEVDS